MFLGFYILIVWGCLIVEFIRVIKIVWVNGIDKDFGLFGCLDLIVYSSFKNVDDDDTNGHWLHQRWCRNYYWLRIGVY